MGRDRRTFGVQGTFGDRARRGAQAVFPRAGDAARPRVRAHGRMGAVRRPLQDRQARFARRRGVVEGPRARARFGRRAAPSAHAQAEDFPHVAGRHQGRNGDVRAGRQRRRAQGPVCGGQWGNLRGPELRGAGGAARGSARTDATAHARRAARRVRRRCGRPGAHALCGHRSAPREPRAGGGHRAERAGPSRWGHRWRHHPGGELRCRRRCQAAGQARRTARAGIGHDARDAPDHARRHGDQPRHRQVGRQRSAAGRDFRRRRAGQGRARAVGAGR